VHHNIVKLDPEKLFEHPLVKMKEGEKGRRLWGTKANTVEAFGRDLEKVVWEEVKVVACEISPDQCRKAVHRIVEVYES
jgi:alpha 1,2-mannosyltransferase